MGGREGSVAKTFATEGGRLEFGFPNTHFLYNPTQQCVAITPVWGARERCISEWLIYLNRWPSGSVRDLVSKCKVDEINEDSQYQYLTSICNLHAQ